MNYRNLDDYELVKQFQGGNNSSFEVLMERYKNKVYTYILITVKKPDLAEDIFQDTFLKVIKSLQAKKYTDNGRFLSWVIRIAHNLIIDYYRKASNAKTYTHEEKDFDYYCNKNGDSKNIEDELITNQIENDVKKLLNKLPDEQREVVVLRHYIGLSFKEISEETNVSINTALGRMRYALINMRKMVKENNMTLMYY